MDLVFCLVVNYTHTHTYISALNSGGRSVGIVHLRLKTQRILRFSGMLRRVALV
jgi:hypothetical protein